MRAVLVIALFAAALATAGAQSAAPEVKRGLTGELTFEYAGPELIADPHQDLSAPLLLRLERAGATTYTARFIGSVEGDYDLRSLIRDRAGAQPGDLQPLPVTIVSNLPESFATDLYDAADLRVGLSGGYWLTLVSLAGLWLAVPAAVLIHRATRARPVEAVETAPPAPTLADQLRPLVVAASQRELTVAEQGRLELLLLHYWRERIAADAPDVAAAITRIRRHPEAGELLAAVESWLHSPDPRNHDPARLEALLAPYRSEPAARESDLEPARTEGVAT